MNKVGASDVELGKPGGDKGRESEPLLGAAKPRTRPVIVSILVVTAVAAVVGLTAYLHASARVSVTTELVCSAGCPEVRSPNCSRPVIGEQCSIPAPTPCCLWDGPVCLRESGWRECTWVSRLGNTDWRDVDSVFLLIVSVVIGATALLSVMCYWIHLSD